MKIFPAIDIKDKKCVRLVKGDFKKITIYNQSPLEQAKKFLKLGFKNLHIVDLDGAISGESKNFNIIESIIKNIPLKIQTGGGIRNIEHIKRLIDIGVENVILGSAAVSDIDFLKTACKKYPAKVAIALDVRDNFLAIKGWKEKSEIGIYEYIDRINDFGVSRIIFTDINRDGTKMGPNIEESINISKISKSPVIISAGISSLNDLKEIKKKNEKNIEGVIIGKAIYDGNIDLNELSKLV